MADFTSSLDDEEVPVIEDVTPEESAIRRDGMKQGDYYKKWDNFADDSEKKLDDEELAATAEADAALGKNKYANSEAEKKDQDTNAALREAKKVWDKRAALEEAAKFEVTGENGANRVLEQEVLGGKRVVLFKNCKDSVYELPASLAGMIKVFVESCEGCTITVKCKLVTSYLEISHCERLTCNIEESLVHTVQVDLTDGVTLRFGDNLLVEGQGQKVYHAGVKNMDVFGSTNGRHLSAHADYIADGADDVELAEEQHFITQVVEHELVTERAIKVGNRWATQRELDLETEAAASVTQREREELAAEAERSKLMGNQSFSAGEYAQAAVHYTMAIDQAGTAEGGMATDAAAEGGEAADAAAPVNPLVPICYSNRAACFLKLGQHDRALEDADQCIKVHPTFVKGHFRRGLALHAMKRYPEALPSLGRALDLEKPTSKASLKQIKDAIRFAEAKLAAARRG